MRNENRLLAGLGVVLGAVGVGTILLEETWRDNRPLAWEASLNALKIELVERACLQSALADMPSHRIITQIVFDLPGNSEDRPVGIRRGERVSFDPGYNDECPALPQRQPFDILPRVGGPEF